MKKTIMAMLAAATLLGGAVNARTGRIWRG